MSALSMSLSNISQQYPNNPCLSLGDSSLSYSALEKKSNQVAAYLLSKGLKKGDRVGIFSDKSFEEVTTIFAVFKVGLILVHINPAYKKEQLLHISKDCNLKALFIDSRHHPILDQIKQDQCIDIVVNLSDINDLGTGFIYMEQFSHILTSKQSSDSRRIPYITVSEDEVAAIIYTSGSTGNPKGIMVTHRVLNDATRVSISVLRNTGKDRLISISPFSFDGSLSQLLTMVYLGGALILQKSLFPKDIIKTMIGKKITGFHAVPTFWRMLLQPHSPFFRYKYPFLRYISIIGESISGKDLAQLRSVLTKTEIFVMYGITEAFRSTFLPPHQIDIKKGSVGKAFPGVTIDVLDENGKRCEPGVVGEIVHAGHFVASGYWNNPLKTAQVFREGCVYTGDLGMLDEDGYLYFKGRKDQLMKIRGFRVNPDEIETCLLRLDGIKEVAAFSYSDDKGIDCIHVCVGIGENSSLNKADINKYCRTALPYYMVPDRISIRVTLPKTGNGKINRSEIQKAL